MQEQRVQVHVVPLHVNQHARVLIAQLSQLLPGRYIHISENLMPDSMFLDLAHRRQTL